MKRSIVVFGLLLISLVAIGFPAAEVQDEKSMSARIDELFHRWDSTDSPGAALAVIKDGMVVYRHGYGSANLEYGVPITPSTIFHVASVSSRPPRSGPSARRYQSIPRFSTTMLVDLSFRMG